MLISEHDTPENEAVNLLKRNSDDVGWEYGVLVDAKNKDKVKCKFCNHQSQGGIHRLKQHVANVGKNVKKCRKNTQEAKDKCKKSLDESKRKRKDVKLCLSVFEPLVKVLLLVDGDVKPSMGFLSGELLKAKREINEAYGNVESRYKDVIDNIDKKMKGRLDSPLHLTAYLLNPYYSYGNPSIFDDATITERIISYVETFYHHDEDKQDQVVNTELKKFQNREGPFNKKLAKTCENFDYNPAFWWRLYGTETPALQKIATRILSLTSSSSGCERNWSTFEMVHTKKRNRLTTTCLNKLVYIQFNSKMINKKEKIKAKKIMDVLLSSDTTEAQGFLKSREMIVQLLSLEIRKMRRCQVQGYLGLLLEMQWEQKRTAQCHVPCYDKCYQF